MIGFTITCNKCGKEEEFKEQKSWIGEKIELHPASWGGSVYLEIECTNPKCRESVELESM